MKDWTDDFVRQACLSFPNLKNYIMQCFDMGDIEQCMNLLMALEFDGRKDV